MKSLTRETRFRLNYLLGKLAEEAGEVAQDAMKCQAFGLDERYQDLPTNKERLSIEIQDLAVIVTMLNEEFDLGCKNPTPEFEKKKRYKVNYYYDVSKQCMIKGLR